MTSPNSVTTRGGQYICLAFLLACFFFYFSSAIWDSDTWWHMASGKWIAENGELPDVDPFQVFSGNDDVRSNTVLKGQWLGQLALYSVYDLFDARGLILLRAAILAACLFLLFWRSRKLGASLFATWVMVSLAGLIALGFTADRPQLFSYLFAVSIFLLLELFERDKKIRWLLPLPFIAMLWANTHGGFLLMAVLLSIYTALYMLQSLAKYKKPDAMTVMLVMALVMFVLATLLTPNGVTTYKYLFDLEGSQLQSMTSEYRSPFKLYEMGYALPQLWVALIYGAALIALAGLFRAPPQRFVLTLTLAVIGAIAYRYFAFFIFLAGPYIAQGMTLTLKDNVIATSDAAAVVNKYSGLLVLLSSLVFIGHGFNNNLFFQDNIKQDMFPARAVELIKQQNIRGKVFNHMQWGGYLLWHVDPQLKIYIDGRMLDENKIPPYTNMLWATPPGVDVFNKENFDLVLLPKTNRFTGEEYKLNHYLLTRPDWMLLYQDQQSYLFQKRYQ